MLSARGAVTPPIRGMVTEHDYMIRAVREQVFASDTEFQRFFRGSSELAEARTLDYLFATSGDPHKPAQVFDRMRWGGQFIFATRNGRECESLSQAFAKTGFVIERGPERIAKRLFGIPLLGFGPRLYFFVARKVLLVRPGDFTNRFTYDVYLEKYKGEYAVCKRIPDVESVAQRLHERNPTTSLDELTKHAQQLVRGVLPVFLTREAGFLQILQRDLPEKYRRRFPTAVEVVQGERDMVQRLRLNWLRKTDRTMSQVDFAFQAADLLHQLHQHAKIVHMDLRLDNFVITEDGVGFVDFGSAARAGENIAASPVLHKLFTQLLRSSQIQRTLEHMAVKKWVTARFITAAAHKVDRAADLFFLALQMERPDTNPYIRELVLHHPGSLEARMISQLTAQLLRPADPMCPTLGSALALAKALRDVKHRMS